MSNYNELLSFLPSRKPPVSLDSKIVDTNFSF